MPVPVTLNQPERALVRVVNTERTARGLPPLHSVRGLSRVARSHSLDQMRHLLIGHASSNGTPFGRRVARAGHFRLKGEVVAYTSLSAEATARRIWALWMASPSHRAELLDPRFRALGVGWVAGASGTWVTADLARR